MDLDLAGNSSLVAIVPTTILSLKGFDERHIAQPIEIAFQARRCTIESSYD